MREIHLPPTHADRHNSPNASSTVHVAGSTLLMGVFAFTCVASLCFSIYAIGRAEAAGERARLAERETRIMEADFQYVRAWASARGVYLPANHEEAESNESSDHHQRPELTIATAGGARGEDRVRLRSER